MNPLDTLLADVATTAANAGARLDQDVQQRLHKLNGRVMLIETTSPRNAWTLSVHNGRINIEPGETSQPNVVIRGSVAALLTAITGTLNQSVQIDGDEVTLHEFQAVFKAFRPDFFSPLRELFGNKTADGLKGAADDLLGAAEVAFQGVRALVNGAAESVKAEAGKQFVSGATRDQWLDTLDELKLKLDRLNARTDILERAGRSISTDAD